MIFPQDQGEQTMKNNKVEWVRKVYSDGRWNGQTDIVRWRDRYYICSRNGSNHPVPPPYPQDGRMIISSSQDLSTWRVETIIELADQNLIDPHLLATEDRLFLYLMACRLEAAYTGSCAKPMVSSSQDGKNWSEPKQCFIQTQNFWRPQAYSCGY